LRPRRSRVPARRGRAGATFIGVRLERVSLALQARLRLRAIDWEIRPGQRWLLLGENGTGKTLLLKLLAGDIWPTAGRGRRGYQYRGEQFEDPYTVKQLIAYIGAERQDRYERYRWNSRVTAVVGTGLHRTDIPLDTLSARDRARIASLLRRLGLEAFARRRFLSLSYGERRLVLLARAIASAPKLLLLDELLSGLDALNRERALRCLAVLSRSALPWVLTSHRVDELVPGVTHYAVIERGRLTYAAAAPRARTRAAALKAGALPGARGRDRELLKKAAQLRANRRTRHAPTRSSRARRTPPSHSVLTLKNATVWRDGSAALRGLSLAIRSGECWVVRGPNGSGKSTLMQLLYGDLGVDGGGRVERAGFDPGTSIAQFKQRVGLVSPELQTLHPRGLRVDEVVASGRRASIGHAGAIGARARGLVRAVLARMQIKQLECNTLNSLSYGQVRQVLFARALIGEPDILLLDEPYAGLDAQTRTRLRAWVDEAVQSGVTIVIGTHHSEDWPAGATHELELARGRALYCGPIRRERAGRG
jgi:molybdate transport system ATP-binding protein